MDANTPDDSSERFRLYTVAELLNRATPDWLIEGVFKKGGLVGLYGAPGDGKTFLALDWSLSIADGIDWKGRSVSQGTVVYVAAEGGDSISHRIQAWMVHRDLREIPAAFFLLEAVQVRERADLQDLIDKIRERSAEPHLIVIDTLARCFVGGDENSAQQMGEFIDGLATLQKETGAAVVVLHHTAKKSNVERGSTAFRAAADAMVHVSQNKKGIITVANDKQKDAEPFEPIKLKLSQVPIIDSLGNQSTSCVLIREGEEDNQEVKVLPKHLRRALMALAEYPHQTASTREWIDAAGMKERTLHSHRDELIEDEYVGQVERGTYRLTDKGRAALGTAATAKPLKLVSSSSGPSDAAATATPPLGVGIAAQAKKSWVRTNFGGARR